MEDKRFDFLSTRLSVVEVANDYLINIELWHCLDAFENHIYGVFLQYYRIIADLTVRKQNNTQNVPLSKASLDIYYYILTWDKLKKIYAKIDAIISRLQRGVCSMPKAFISDFRLWKRRMVHVFKEFNSKIRNEYEHPSLESYAIDNIIMWGNIYGDVSGNIEAHVGKNWFASIKKEHIEKIMALRTDLFDLFIKHFSTKPLTRELIEVRDYYEKNLDSILAELKEFKDKGDIKGFNDSLYRFTMHDICLSREGVQLSKDTKKKIYSIIWS